MSHSYTWEVSEKGNARRAEHARKYWGIGSTYPGSPTKLTGVTGDVPCVNCERYKSAHGYGGEWEACGNYEPISCRRYEAP